jgi:hypothetical protein
VENYPICIEIGLVFEYSSTFLGESHEIPDILIRSDHLYLGNWFFDMDIGSRFWYILGIRDIEICTLSSSELDEFPSRSWIESYFVSSDEELVGNLWTCDNHIHIILPPESLLHDIEMEKSEESTTESISQCRRCLVFRN